MNEVKEGSSSWLKKYWWVLVIGALVIIAGIVVAFKVVNRSKDHGPKNDRPDISSNPDSGKQGSENSSDAVAAGMELSHGACKGEGSKQIGAPMDAKSIGIIQPMGLMVGGHVTPVDHEYYYQKDPSARRDTYEVLAPADGTIVEITHRGSAINTPSGTKNNPSSDEYRFVISYSCTFFSYADLVTSVDPEIKAKANLDSQGNGHDVNIPVKAGQVIGRIGGQSLDFAVWDTTKTLSGLLVPAAYNNAEPWKIHTVEPLNYFTDEAKAMLLPFYQRTVEPRDGKIDYDIEGKVVGTWFKEGTNGYLGALTNESRPQEYWKGHLTLAYTNIDPKTIEISIGNFGGQAKQFIVTGNTPDPATLDMSSGVTKYELQDFDFRTSDGVMWTGNAPATVTVHAKTVEGTLLVQMTEAHKMKVEVFVGKKASEVTGFDDKAVMYTRGDGATIPASNSAR